MSWVGDSGVPLAVPRLSPSSAPLTPQQTPLELVWPLCSHHVQGTIPNPLISRGSTSHPVCVTPVPPVSIPELPRSAGSEGLSQPQELLHFPTMAISPRTTWPLWGLVDFCDGDRGETHLSSQNSQGERERAAPAGGTRTGGQEEDQLCAEWTVGHSEGIGTLTGKPGGLIHGFTKSLHSSLCSSLGIHIKLYI